MLIKLWMLIDVERMKNWVDVDSGENKKCSSTRFLIESFLTKAVFNFKLHGYTLLPIPLKRNE